MRTSIGSYIVIKKGHSVMLSFKQLKQKLMNDLKQRVIKNYAYDKKADDDIHYHLNFGAKQPISKTSKNNMVLNLVMQLSEQVQTLANKVDVLTQHTDNINQQMNQGFEKINARLDQLENQAIAQGWNIKKI